MICDTVEFVIFTMTQNNGHIDLRPVHANDSRNR